ncbi:MAG: hypothetical protein ACLFQB_02850 [Chitinispirillaceae bacterium]
MIITSPVMNILARVLFFSEALTVNMAFGLLIILSSSTFLILDKCRTNISKKEVNVENVAA